MHLVQALTISSDTFTDAQQDSQISSAGNDVQNKEVKNTIYWLRSTSLRKKSHSTNSFLPPRPQSSDDNRSVR